MGSGFRVQGLELGDWGLFEFGVEGSRFNMKG
jgi:hypothetical protein